MALTKLTFKPGIVKENTTYTSEGGFYSCDKVRFRSGQAEKIGGWINAFPDDTYHGVARTLYNWIPSTAEDLLAVGTNQGYYVEYGGMYNEITPLRVTRTIGVDPIATTNGLSYQVITDTGHGASAGTWITISGAAAVASVTANGTYEIISVLTGDTYVIYTGQTASATTTGGGAAVQVAYNINSGSNTSYVYGGWGSGTWGSGVWGESSISAIDTPIQQWSQCTFDDDLIFASSGNTIYYWALDTATFARAITLEAYANTQVATTTTATFGGGVTTITVGSGLDIRPGAVISGTNITAGTYVTTAYLGGTSVPISAVTGGASSGNYTFSYSGRSVPNEVNYIVSSDVGQFVIALGSNPYDPTDFDSDFDPMLVRWSDTLNPYQWVPQTDNQAGEQHLNNGSYLVTARNTRQEILVWSDSALYSMQFIGAPFVWNFTMLMDHISIASPSAAIVVNNVTFWMGLDKFYTYTGQVGTLDCSIWKFIFDDFNTDQADLVVSGSNPSFNEIWWFYPSSGSTINDSYAIYNYLENVWSYGTLTRTAWTYSPNRVFPMAAFSIQNSYVASAGGGISDYDTFVNLVDASSYPDSGVIIIESEEIYYAGKTGNILSPCTRGYNGTTATTHALYLPVNFKTPSQVMFHEYGVDDGSETNLLPISAYIESADFDIGDGDHFMFVWRMVPDLDFEGSTAGSPVVDISLKVRRNSGTAYTGDGNDPSVTRTATYPVDQFTGQIYTRVRGRQMKMRIESSALGVQWQLGSMRIDARQDGRR